MCSEQLTPHPKTEITLFSTPRMGLSMLFLRTLGLALMYAVSEGSSVWTFLPLHALVLPVLLGPRFFPATLSFKKQEPVYFNSWYGTWERSHLPRCYPFLSPEH